MCWCFVVWLLVEPTFRRRCLWIPNLSQDILIRKFLDNIYKRTIEPTDARQTDTGTVQQASAVFGWKGARSANETSGDCIVPN